jgi:phosphoserine phosphatase
MPLNVQNGGGFMVQFDEKAYGLSKARLEAIFEPSTFVELGAYTKRTDSQNDLEMFKYADISICMGNGDEQAKKRADYITDDINNDGILHALQHFNWIKE